MQIKGFGRKNEIILIAVLDCLVMACSGVLSLLTRFDFSFGEIPETVVDQWLLFLPVQIVVTLVFFWFRKMTPAYLSMTVTRY